MMLKPSLWARIQTPSQVPLSISARSPIPWILFDLETSSSFFCTPQWSTSDAHSCALETQVLLLYTDFVWMLCRIHSPLIPLIDRINRPITNIFALFITIPKFSFNNWSNYPDTRNAGLPHTRSQVIYDSLECTMSAMAKFVHYELASHCSQAFVPSVLLALGFGLVLEGCWQRRQCPVG